MYYLLYSKDLTKNAPKFINCIYVIEFTNNGKFYIGKSNNFKKRWYQYLANIKHPKRPVDCALLTYFDNVKIHLYDGYKSDDLYDIEKLEILRYDSHYPSGYNGNLGGYGGQLGRKLSQETKNKMSLAKKGKAPLIMTDEIKAKISLANKNRVISDETRLKISNSMLGKKNSKGKKLSQQTKDKMSKSKLGKKRGPTSQETKEKISKSKIGIAQQKHSQESYDKNAKKYIITTPNNETKIILNLSTFCKENKLNYKCMYRVVMGVRKTYKGYKIKHY